jgi:hypothetical protein
VARDRGIQIRHHLIGDIFRTRDDRRNHPKVDHSLGEYLGRLRKPLT